MAEISTVTVKLPFSGIVQSVDPALLPPSAYQQLENLRVLQEGALTTRRGCVKVRQLAGSQSGIVKKLRKFRKPDGTLLIYYQLGNVLKRVNLSTGQTSDVAQNVTHWDLVEYYAGQQGGPLAYIAAGSQMLRDDGSTLSDWGIQPPANAPSVGVAPLTPIYLYQGTYTIEATSQGWWTWRVDYSPRLDLSAGGDPLRHYTSTDPIKLELSMSNPSAVSEIRVLIGLGTSGSWNGIDYYVQSIVPSTLQGYVAREQTASQAAADRVSMVDSGALGWDYEQPYEPVPIPEELPPVEPQQAITVTVSLRKDKFVPVGNADTGELDWRNVTALYVMVNVTGACTVSFSNVRLEGMAGPSNSGPTDAPYRYVYTYYSEATGSESNPSPESEGIIVNRDRIRVTVAGSNDPKVTHIRLYRAGGTFADGEFRYVTQVQNSSGTVQIYDVYGDDEIAGSPTLLRDNFTPPQATIATTAFDSIFLAGIPTKPHLLVRSKVSNPESFPIVEEVTGNAYQLYVGSPSDPIMAITEFRGMLVCLNRESIYVVPVWLGTMQSPVKTASQRGLIGRNAWCQTEREIWFVSHDGVYSWSGGSAVLRSGAIQWMFRGEEVNGIKPLDLSPTGIEYITMAYHAGAIWITARQTDSRAIVLVCDLTGSEAGRWSIYVAPPGSAITALLEDPYDGTLYSARWSQSEVSLNKEDTGNSDDGQAIYWSFLTGWADLGVVDAGLSDLAVEYSADNAITLSVYSNFSESSVVLTKQLPSQSSRTRYVIHLTDSESKPKASRIRALSFRLSGSGKASIHTISYSFFSEGQALSGRTEDWDDLGYPWDKEISGIAIEYRASASMTVYLDTITGTGPGQISLASKVFELEARERGKYTAAFDEPIIAKMVRLRYECAGECSVLSRVFYSKRLPPDTVSVTDWTDSGYAFEKYYQQLVLEVDTGGEDATVYVDVDGVQKWQTTINSTWQDRIRILTMPQGIKGRMARIRASTQGKFQLYGWYFIVAPADKGPVVHTVDWQDLGWPHDKLLRYLSLEYEVTEDTDVNLYGFPGYESTPIRTIRLKSGGRKQATYPMPKDVVVKLIRFEPKDPSVTFKSWKYQFDYEQYPPDFVPFTYWEDNGWPHEKVYRRVTLDVDTAGEDVTLALDIDGSEVEQLTVNANGRSTVDISFSALWQGYKARLVVKPNQSGQLPNKFQLFGVVWDVLREPPRIQSWRTREISFPSPAMLKKLWFKYASSAPVRLKVYVDSRLLHEVSFPKSTKPVTICELMPGTNGAARNRFRQLNIEAETSGWMKIYPDGSTLEYVLLAGYERASYMRLKLSDALGLSV